MSIFDFDTGVEARPAGNPYAVKADSDILDRVLDTLPIDATQAQKDAALVLYCKGWLCEARQRKTIVRRGLDVLRVCADVAERDPALFIDLLQEFAERVERFG